MDKNQKETEKNIHKLRLKKTKYQLLKTLMLFAVYSRKKELAKKIRVDSFVYIMGKCLKFNLRLFRNKVMMNPYNRFQNAFKSVSRIFLRHSFASFNESLFSISAQRAKLRKVLRACEKNSDHFLQKQFMKLRNFNYYFSLNKKYFENYVS